MADTAGSGGLAQVSMEQVLAWDPQVIVATDQRFFASVRRHDASGNLDGRAARGGAGGGTRLILRAHG